MDGDQSCFICGHDICDAKHILVHCPTVRKARDIYAQTLDLKLTTAALSTDSCTATDADIAYLSFDGTIKLEEVKAIVISTDVTPLGTSSRTIFFHSGQPLRRVK